TAAGAARSPAPADRAREDRGAVGARDRAADRHVGLGREDRRASRAEGAGREDPERAMKTDDLVTMLATGAGAFEPSAANRRFALAVGWGALGAALLMAVLLGARDDLAQASGLPMFWVKFAFVAALTAASVVAALRLSRPGASLG